MVLYKKLEKLLLEAGLSEQEILIYISLLKKPALTVWEIVQRTGLKKSTVYDAFSVLKGLQMVEKTSETIRALSLKTLVTELSRKQRKTGKTAYKLKQIAPFLRLPRETIEEFETFYTPDQIIDAYLEMAVLPYDVNLDFGDYENFITAIGSNDLGLQFRNKRAKHASHHAICTTYGPNLAAFCKKEDLQKFKNIFDVHPELHFQNRWIIFSDTNDYVLFNDVSEPDYPCSTLVKSKAVADIQRLQFDNFSRLFRKAQNAASSVAGCS